MVLPKAAVVEGMEAGEVVAEVQALITADREVEVEVLEAEDLAVEGEAAVQVEEVLQGEIALLVTKTNSLELVYESQTGIHIPWYRLRNLFTTLILIS